MTFPASSRALGIRQRITMQDDPRDLRPVCPIGFGVEQAHVGDEVRLVIDRDLWLYRSQVIDIGASSGRTRMARPSLRCSAAWHPEMG